jgi:hypothetical protein
MRFPHSFALRVSSRCAKLRLSSRLTISLGPIARSTQGRKNLTEFPFDHNFCKLGLERR